MAMAMVSLLGIPENIICIKGMLKRGMIHAPGCCRATDPSEFTALPLSGGAHLWCSSRPMGSCTAAAFSLSFSRAAAMTRHGFEPCVHRWTAGEVSSCLVEDAAMALEDRAAPCCTPPLGALLLQVWCTHAVQACLADLLQPCAVSMLQVPPAYHAIQLVDEHQARHIVALHLTVHCDGLQGFAHA
jgi:hypothetical protein